MNFKNSVVVFSTVLILCGCANKETPPFKPNESYLKANPSQANETVVQDIIDKNALPSSKGAKMLPSFTTDNVYDNNKSKYLETPFSDTQMVEIAADELLVKDFLHYVFGDVLGVSYVLGDEIQKDVQGMTLNIKQAISKQKLYQLSSELLLQRGYVVRFDDGIYYIHKDNASNTQADIAYGYGNNVKNVPNTSLNIVQMVPLAFGMQTPLANTLRQLTKVQASPDFERNAILLEGKRRDILRGLEFINLMDQPQFRNRHIGSYQTTFVSTDELTANLPSLLKQEGITYGTADQNDKAVSIVTLDRLSTLIIFASNAALIDRVVYWAEQLDKPSVGSELQYFVYYPDYSRASDLGESILQLIGGQSGGSVSDKTSAAQQNEKSQTKTINKNMSASGDNTTLVVDERSNSLVFKTTGEQYRKLHPLIKRLDVLPKQVMLEVVIAEVSLTDEFKQGVEFAFNSGSYGVSTEGAFLGEGFGGLSYLLTGAKGQLALNLFQTNSLVNILSRPSLVVRDGVLASISVGTNIPIVGQTSSDPLTSERQTTSIEYRKTGVQLDVTPTVNSRGFVIMEINQTISNEVDSGGTTIGGNPSLFERSISTEVIAESGQTIILGGLISENKSNKDTKVPFFGDIPLLGNLFQAKTNSGDKTELVIMMTPRIIESSSEWDDVKAKFNNELKKITIY